MSLTIQHVTGGYGHLPVLKDINFEVHNGEMIGLIGLNGAGKSTTIKNIIGLLTPQKGTIAVDDLTLQQDPENYRKKIGYIPETPSLYEELTLRDPLAINALLELMVTMKEQGAAILMSTHILATAEKYCDRFIVLHEGEVRAQGTLQELQAEFNLPGSSLDEIYIALTKEKEHA